MGKDNNKEKKIFFTALFFYVLFAFILVSVLLIDVRPVGPMDSEIGLSGLNTAIRDFFGVNMIWYEITDVLGLVSIFTAFCFGVFGLYQFIKNKSLKKVDKDIILLGVFYVLVIAIYCIFEICIVNYRPILIEAELEASFPSSHTMLVVCIMGTSIFQLFRRIKNLTLRNICVIVCGVILAVTVIGRMICGVHWFTDILGGLFLSIGLILTYVGVVYKLK